MASDDRDWRSWAYLQKDNWPECIPWYGPKREYGPYPWSVPDHDDPDDLDDYPHMHPDSASVGDTYLGDVCPFCGVPLRWDEEVVLLDGSRGVFHEINELEEPEPAYHPECWAERRGITITRLEGFADA